MDNAAHYLTAEVADDGISLSLDGEPIAYMNGDTDGITNAARIVNLWNADADIRRASLAAAANDQPEREAGGPVR